MFNSRWYKKHSIDLNLEYVMEILEQFDISDYHFISDGYGSSALLVKYGIHSYRIETNQQEEKMYVRKQVFKRKAQRHMKEYWNVIGVFHTDCIFNSIKKIKLENKY